MRNQQDSKLIGKNVGGNLDTEKCSCVKFREFGSAIESSELI